MNKTIKLTDKERVALEFLSGTPDAYAHQIGLAVQGEMMTARSQTACGAHVAAGLVRKQLVSQYILPRTRVYNYKITQAGREAI